jgi:uncharacterized protein (TIGR02594 family)
MSGVAATKIIDVDLNTAAFDKLKAQFDVFNDAVKKQPAAWKAVGEESKRVAAALKAAEGTFKSLNAQQKANAAQSKKEREEKKDADAAAKKSAAETKAIEDKKRAEQRDAENKQKQALKDAAAAEKKSLQTQKEMMKAAAESRKVFHDTVSDSSKLLKNVAATTQAMLRWVGIGGIFSGLLGAGSMFGIDRLALAVSGNSRSARGTGVSYGEQASFRLNYGRYVDPDALLSKIAEAKNDMTKRWAFGAVGISGDPNKMGTQDLAMQVYRNSRNMWAHSDHSAQFAQAHGIDQFLSLDDLRRGETYSDADIGASERATGKNNRDLNVGGDLEQRYQKFATTLDLAWQKIENVFIKGLDPLLPGLTKLSDAFSDAVKIFLNNPNFGKWMEEAGAGLKVFAEYVGSDKFQNDVRDFADDLVRLVEAVGKAANWFSGIVLGNGSNVPGAVGSNIDNNGNQTSWLTRLFPGLVHGGTGASSFSHANNPWNLKFAGQDGATQDGKFAAFGSLEAGAATDLKQWRKYQTDDHLSSIEDMILKATPRSENPNVDAYIDDVARIMGRDRKDNIDLTDPATATMFLAAVAKNEGNGKGLDIDAIGRGVNNALGTTNRVIKQGSATTWVGRKILPTWLGGDQTTAGSGSDAFSSAVNHVGEGPDQINSYLKDNGGTIDAAKTAWCAAFVNAALRSVGITGTGSDVATSFDKWGKSVGLDDISKGDILVQGRGHAPGEVGGHVGFATGNTRVVEGHRQIEMLSGNEGGKVSRSWENADGIDIRRQVRDKIDADALADPKAPAAPQSIQPGHPQHVGYFPGRSGGAHIVIQNNTGGNATVTASMLAV